MNHFCHELRWVRRWALLALCLAAGAGAHAYQELGAEMQYNLTEQKNAGADVLTRSNVSTNLLFLYQGPITPGSGLSSDVRLNASTLNDTLSQTANTTFILNLYNTKPDYTFIGRLTRSDASSTSNLQALTADTVTTNYAANLLLRRPDYPLLNVQYQYQTANSTYGDTASGYTDSDWRFSGQYTRAPFYFSYDRTAQSMRTGAAPALNAMTERAAVTAVQPLGSGMEFTGEYDRLYTNASGGSASTSDNGLLRLTVTPTHALTGNIEYALQSAENVVDARRDPSSDHTLTVGARADVCTGLSLEYGGYWLGQHGSTAGVASTSGTTNQTLSLTSRLAEDTVLSASGYRTEDTLDGQRADREDTVQGALQTSLGSSSDFTWSLGNTATLGTGPSHGSSTYTGLALRNRANPRATYGVAYTWMTSQNVDSNDVAGRAINNGVTTDLLWMLTSQAVLDLRLGYLLSRGTATTQQLTPSANFRWQLTPSTNLGVSYDINENAQWGDPANAQPGLQTTNLHVHLLRTYHRGSNITIDYYVTRANTGVVEWQRQLSTSVTFQF